LCFNTQNENWLMALRHVAGYTGLLLETTVASRIPCLSRKRRLKLIALLLFALFVFTYVALSCGWPPAIGATNLLAIALSIFAISFSVWADKAHEVSAILASAPRARTRHAPVADCLWLGCCYADFSTDPRNTRRQSVASHSLERSIHVLVVARGDPV